MWASWLLWEAHLLSRKPRWSLSDCTLPQVGVQWCDGGTSSWKVPYPRVSKDTPPGPQPRLLQKLQLGLGEGLEEGKAPRMGEHHPPTRGHGNGGKRRCGDNKQGCLAAGGAEGPEPADPPRQSKFSLSPTGVPRLGKPPLQYKPPSQRGTAAGWQQLCHCPGLHIWLQASRMRTLPFCRPPGVTLARAL